MKSYKKAISLFMGSAFALLAGVAITTANAHEGHHDGDHKAGVKGHHFAKMDTNGDGKISADEHATMAAKRFSKMDTNGDGFVDKAEMKAHHKKMRDMWKKHHKSCDK
jgi:hypothetical protein